MFDGVDFPLPNFLAEAAIWGIFGENSTTAADVEKQPRYHYQSFNDARLVISNVVTDYWFRCASEVFLRASSARRLFAYRCVCKHPPCARATYPFRAILSPRRPLPPPPQRFNHLYSNASIFPTFGLPQVCATVVCHASELPFVFHNVPSFASFTPAEDALALAMGTAWANFAKTGDPNGQGAPAWPAWSPSNRSSLVLNDPFAVEDTNSLCGFWDAIGNYFA